jgi:hypothetical protein
MMDHSMNDENGIGSVCSVIKDVMKSWSNSNKNCAVIKHQTHLNPVLAVPTCWLIQIQILFQTPLWPDATQQRQIPPQEVAPPPPPLQQAAEALRDEGGLLEAVAQAEDASVQFSDGNALDVEADPVAVARRDGALSDEESIRPVQLPWVFDLIIMMTPTSLLLNKSQQNLTRLMLHPIRQLILLSLRLTLNAYNESYMMERRMYKYTSQVATSACLVLIPVSWMTLVLNQMYVVTGIVVSWQISGPLASFWP